MPLTSTPPSPMGAGKSFDLDMRLMVQSKLFVNCDVFTEKTICLRYYQVMGTVVRMTKMVSSLCLQMSSNSTTNRSQELFTTVNHEVQL